MSWIAVGVVGAAAIGGGTFLEGEGASKRRKALKKIANTPGVNLKGETLAALADIEEAFPQAEGIAERTGLANQRILNQLLEESLPGFARMQEKRKDVINEFLEGRLPQDVQESISRSAAGKALQRGPLGANLQFRGEARDVGLTSLDLIGRGLGEAGRFQTSLPIANAPAVSDFFGPGPLDRIKIKSAERAQRMNLLAARAGLPTSGEVYGQGLQQIGGLVLGGATGGLFGGFGGGGSFINDYMGATGGFQAPDNFGSLTPGQQAAYRDMWRQNSYLNPAKFE